MTESDSEMGKPAGGRAASGPLLIVGDENDGPLSAFAEEAGFFPVVESPWSDAPAAFASIAPGAVIADLRGTILDGARDWLNSIADIAPYAPVIGVGNYPAIDWPGHVLPVSANGDATLLVARLQSALRVRSLHTAVLGRLASEAAPALREAGETVLRGDLMSDAVLLLVGRGRDYPALSLAAGTRAAVIGAFTVEAAAGHLNAREIDGIVIGRGLSPRMVEGLLKVLSADARFRNLPVIVAGNVAADDALSLPNLQIVDGVGADVIEAAVPLIRQKVLEQRLKRLLSAIDAGGSRDARTSLLTPDAFDRDFSNAAASARARGTALSVARFRFEPGDERAALDAAYIIGKLLRASDFATLVGSGGIDFCDAPASSRASEITIAFTDTDLRGANVIVRRLASVLKHTLIQRRNGDRIALHAALVSMKGIDTAASLIERLEQAAAQEC